MSKMCFRVFYVFYRDKLQTQTKNTKNNNDEYFITYKVLVCVFCVFDCVWKTVIDEQGS